MPELLQYGEEYFLRTSTGDLQPVEQWNIGVFNNENDQLTDSSDVDAIESEPDNENYSRQTISAEDVEFDLPNGDVEFDAPDVTFNFQDNDSTDEIDSWFIVIEYQSEVVTTDSEDTDHLIIYGDLSESRVLDNLDNLTVENIGADLD